MTMSKWSIASCYDNCKFRDRMASQRTGVYSVGRGDRSKDTMKGKKWE